MFIHRHAKFALGAIVQHTELPFQGVVIDVDAACVGPFGPDVMRDQPFYHVLAIGDDGGFTAYVPEDRLGRAEEAGALAPAAIHAFRPSMQPLH